MQDDYNVFKGQLKTHYFRLAYNIIIIIIIIKLEPFYLTSMTKLGRLKHQSKWTLPRFFQLFTWTS